MTFASSLLRWRFFLRVLFGGTNTWRSATAQRRFRAAVAARQGRLDVFEVSCERSTGRGLDHRHWKRGARWHLTLCGPTEAGFLGCRCLQVRHPQGFRFSDTPVRDQGVGGSNPLAHDPYFLSRASISDKTSRQVMAAHRPDPLSQFRPSSSSCPNFVRKLLPTRPNLRIPSRRTVVGFIGTYRVWSVLVARVNYTVNRMLQFEPWKTLTKFPYTSRRCRIIRDNARVLVCAGFVRVLTTNWA